MLTPHSVSVLIAMVLGLVLGIPSNACIVIVHLESMKKKEKLSPSDVIFLAKGTANILLQGFLTLQGILVIFYPVIFSREYVYSLSNVSIFFLTYFSFWMTAWLSIHYCTSITNLSHGFFIWSKGIVSNFLSQILFLTAFGIVLVILPVIWAWNAEDIPQNSTAGLLVTFRVRYPYFMPANILGFNLPFCLSLLFLVLTFSFLVRHVWRVKNNDSESTLPNLQAYVTALRTIFFLLLVSTLICLSQVLMFIRKSKKGTNSISLSSWSLQTLSPSVEAAIIFQANNKLKGIIRRRFYTKT